MTEDDFKNGYRQGFIDGFELAKQTYKTEKKWEQPTIPIPKEGWKPKQSCSVCKMSFVDEMGRPKVMGYVCLHDKCPSRITC